MKRELIAYLIIALTSIGVSAQNPNALSISQDIHDHDVNVLAKEYSNFDSSIAYSIRLAYWRDLSNKWAFSAGVANGFILNRYEEDPLLRRSYFVGWDADIIYKMDNGGLFRQDAPIAPYLTFGYNFNHLPNLKKSSVPSMRISNEYGLGIKFKLNHQSQLLVKLALDQELTGDYNTQIQYRVGYKHNLQRRKELKPKKKEVEYMSPEDMTSSSLSGNYDLDSLERRLSTLSDNILAMQLVLKNMIDDDLVQVRYIEPEVIQEFDTTVKVVYDTVRESFVDTVEIVKTDTIREIEEVVKTDTVFVESTPGEKISPPKERIIYDTVYIEKRDTLFRDRVVTQPIPKTEPKTTAAEPETSTVQSTESVPRGYYVIVMSTLNPTILNNTFTKYKNVYPKVYMLPQDNGYTRIGIYASTQKQDALRLLNYVKKNSEKNAWLSSKW